MDSFRGNFRYFGLGMTATVALAALTGCSSIGNLPTWAGGLPEDVPARPAVRADFPAVHDMPPPRQDRPLTDDEQSRLTQDLEAARDRNARAAGIDPVAAPAKGAGAAPRR